MTELTITPSATPNPNARKFTLNRPVGATMLNLGNPEQARAHPLAAHLFGLPGVTNVFLTRDFITVNKRPELAWEDLESAILTAIQSHFSP